jgi:uncharacterized protein (DUF983 family)
MYIPELPWVSLSFKTRCPSCKETIGGHIVKNRFTCPFCKTILNSNKNEVIKSAVIISAVLYITLFLVINFVSISEWPFIMVVLAGSFAPVLVGIGYFKMNFKICNEKNAL